MDKKALNIVLVSSEVTPFAKTGGLADVCGALPAALSQRGHRVSVMMPAYQQIRAAGIPVTTTGISLKVQVGEKEVWGELLKSQIPHTNVDVYFIRHDHYFYRDGLYNSNGVDYQDNCERFIFFCRGVFEAIERLDLDVDILHANDWQTGLIPAYLKTMYQMGEKSGQTEFFSPDSLSASTSADDLKPNRWKKIKSVFTIHNMRHQGRFWHWDMGLTGIDWKYFTFDKMEFYGQLNLLKTGVIFADAVTTVSPEYSKEIQTEGFGEKLQGVLRFRADVLSGILNGIDTDEWNPAADSDIAACYDVDSVFENKPKCKAALQAELGLAPNLDAPLFGVVSRFDPQKGLDLIADVIPQWVEHAGAQFAVLGTGDHELEARFRDLANRYPKNVGVAIKFGTELSHRIEAGSDLFLMPSRYEPCGLNQMYSQRYGTLPVVRRTGGLADTVVNASQESMVNGTASGFSFYWATAGDLNQAIEWALHCYRDRRDDWNRMIQTAMRIDHSWNGSAEKYEQLYLKLLNRTDDSNL